MTIYYVEPQTGGGSPAGSGTEADPWNGFGNISGLISGDVLVLSAGTFNEELVLQDLNLTVYGQGIGSTVIEGGDTRTTCVTISSASGGMSYLSDMTVQGAANQGVLLRNNASAPYGVTVRRVKAQNLTQNATTQGQCVGFQINNANNVVTTAIIEDCVAFNCGRIGFDTQQFQGSLTLRRCEASNCGALGEGGGFYTHPWRSTTTAAWTAVGGGVYSKAQSSALDGFSGVYNTTSGELFSIAETPTTTPAAGECSVVSNTMYINPALAFVNGTDAIQFSRSDMTVLFEDCISHDNGGYDAEHGSGFHFDDLTENITARRLVAYNCGGKGFRFFLCHGAEASDCLVYNCGTDGDSDARKSNIHAVGININLYNFTSVDPFKVHITASNNPLGEGFGLNIYNCILKGGEIALFETNSGFLVADYTCMHGYTTKTSGTNIMSTNETISDPLLDNSYSLCCDSPCVGIGSTWWAGDPEASLSGNRPKAGYTDLGCYQTQWSEFLPLMRNRLRRRYGI